MNRSTKRFIYKYIFFKIIFILFFLIFNKKFITEGIELILNNNSFQFNHINYIQTLGTSMGTKIAPTYATLTLAYLEENLYKIIGKKITT